MTQSSVHNVNVTSQTTLIAPSALRASVPVDDATFDFVSSSRATISNILDRKDHRLIVVVGPCSIHDRVAAIDYATRLKSLAAELSDTLYIVMRVYFEKPRTTTGWKGLILVKNSLWPDVSVIYLLRFDVYLFIWILPCFTISLNSSGSKS